MARRFKNSATSTNANKFTNHPPLNFVQLETSAVGDFRSWRLPQLETSAAKVLSPIFATNSSTLLSYEKGTPMEHRRTVYFPSNRIKYVSVRNNKPPSIGTGVANVRPETWFFAICLNSLPGLRTIVPPNSSWK